MKFDKDKRILEGCKEKCREMNNLWQRSSQLNKNFRFRVLNDANCPLGLDFLVNHFLVAYPQKYKFYINEH